MFFLKNLKINYSLIIILSLLIVNSPSLIFNYAQQDDLAYLSYYPKDNFFGSHPSHPQHIFLYLVGFPLNGFFGNKFFYFTTYIENYFWVRFFIILVKILFFIFFFKFVCNHENNKSKIIFLALTCLIIFSPQFLIIINWLINSISLITFFISFFSGIVFCKFIINKKIYLFFLAALLLLISFNTSPVVSNIFFSAVALYIIKSNDKVEFIKIFFLSSLFFFIFGVFYFLTNKFLLNFIYLENINMSNVYNSIPERYKLSNYQFNFNTIFYAFKIFKAKYLFLIDPYSINKNFFVFLLFVFLIFIFFLQSMKSNKNLKLKFVLLFFLMFPPLIPVFINEWDLHITKYRSYFSYIFSYSLLMWFVLKNIKFNKHQFNLLLVFLIIFNFVFLSRSTIYNYINGKNLSLEYNLIYNQVIQLKIENKKNIFFVHENINKKFSPRGDGEFYHINTYDHGSTKSLLIEIFRKLGIKKNLIVTDNCNLENNEAIHIININILELKTKLERYHNCKISYININNIF